MVSKKEIITIDMLCIEKMRNKLIQIYQMFNQIMEKFTRIRLKNLSNTQIQIKLKVDDEDD